MLSLTGRKQLIPFLMVGYPSLSDSEALAMALIESGVTILEMGVPFSDPMADGPVIQAAGALALKNGVTLTDVLEMICRLKTRSPQVSFIVFSYLNPLLQYGLEKYVRQAHTHGASATLTVDLPPEEALEYRQIHTDGGLKTIFIAAPTTNSQRLKFIDEASSGFVYAVARAGVTGEQQTLSTSLVEELGHLRRTLHKPVAVGFGISNSNQVRIISSHCQAVVIGSRYLSLIAQSTTLHEAKSQISTLTRECLEVLSERSHHESAIF